MTHSFRAIFCLSLGAVVAVLGAVPPLHAADPPPATLTVTPPTVTFDDFLDRRQLLVTAGASDVTRAARYESRDPAVVAIDQQGYLQPVGAGRTSVVVRHGGSVAEVPVDVPRLNRERPIDFANEIVPILTRAGCNSGGCHGKALGQNGFKLSLFGFDPEYDYEQIVKAARGRRINPAAASASLLLRKASGASPHGGGQRVAFGSEAYQLIERWIARGAPASSAEAPQITGLRLVQQERVLQPGQSQQLVVLAQYSDGSSRDVTRQSQYETNLDVVAEVDGSGLVTAGHNSGEAAIMARYQSKIGVFLALVPHGPPLEEIPDFPIRNFVDRLAAEKWKKLGLRPSPPCDDATFLRRATLDLAGRLPTVDEARAFLADNSADKRAALVDRLLDSPDYAAYFALRWSSILHNSHRAGADQAAYAFHNWIEDKIARNRPYDELVRGVVAASGEWQDAPAINWYWQMRDDQLHQVVADTAQTFLGLRLQCAQCHHHPYERWSQDDYFGLAGFFTRVGRKSFGQPPPYYSSTRVTTGERDPRTGKVPEPKYPDGPVAEFSPFEDPRHGLVDWMTQPDNPFFARAFVNRMWSYLLGRGLIEPVDDMRDTNPASNPELLDALAQDFIDSGFDMKRVVRTIATSRLYGLSSTPTDTNRDDRQNFARYYPRRLIAEVFLDAVDSACGTQTRFSGVASTARAVNLPHPGFGSYFLDTFDRPQRLTGCECERSADATLGQVLLLANSDEIENKLAAGSGRLAQLLKDQSSAEAILDELYLASLSRLPTPAERERARQHLSTASDDKKAEIWQDLLWTLLNCKEFCFHH